MKKNIVLRKIIHIDEDKCNGCGLCVEACHEAAIEMVNNKARLVSDEYCDGLGDCLPECPTGAITMIEKETMAYDDDAVQERLSQIKKEENMACGCPGTAARELKPKERDISSDKPEKVNNTIISELRQWPVQLRLISPNDKSNNIRKRD